MSVGSWLAAISSEAQEKPGATAWNKKEYMAKHPRAMIKPYQVSTAN